jgi:protein pelota
MIINEVKGSSGKAQLVIPEDPDDLFTLRRILEIGDNVIADTTRVVKQVKEFARPDKGERIKVKIILDVQQIGLDGAVGRLRIGGLILKADNELVTKGQHHNLTISVGDVLTLSKNRRWKQSEFDIIKRSASSPFILVAIDTQEAAVALITGTHLRILPNIYSGQSGKRYSTVRKHNTGMEAFFEEVAGTIKTLLARDVANQIVIIFGPGETKRRFHNYLQGHLENTNTTNNNRINMKVIDGVDVAGEDGIHVSLRSDSLKEVMKDTKLGNVAMVLDKVFYLVSKGIPKFAIGINEVSKAAELKSIEHLLYSDTLFHSATEEQVIALLNRVDAIGAKTYAIDSSTDIGLRVSSLGGIVALLRFAVN